MKKLISRITAALRGPERQIRPAREIDLKARADRSAEEMRRLQRSRGGGPWSGKTS